MNALTAVVLLVFSLVLIAIGLVATARLRRSGRATPAPAGSPRPGAQPGWRPRSAQVPDYAPAPMPPGAAPKGGPAQDAPGAAGSAADEWAGQPVTAYPGGMDAEAAEIERLRAEVAALKAHNGDGSGLKRTQALVAVAANVSGILGLLVSVAALIK